MPVEYDQKGARIAWDGASPFFVRAKFPIQFSVPELKALCKPKGASKLWEAIDQKLGERAFDPQDLEVFSSKAVASNLAFEEARLLPSDDTVYLLVVTALELAPDNFGDQPATSAQDARQKMLKWTTFGDGDGNLWDTLQEWHCVDRESTLVFWGNMAYQLNEDEIKTDLTDFIRFTTVSPPIGTRERWLTS